MSGQKHLSLYENNQISFVGAIFAACSLCARHPRCDLKQHAQYTLAVELNLQGMLRIIILNRNEGVAPTVFLPLLMNGAVTAIKLRLNRSLWVR